MCIFDALSSYWLQMCDDVNNIFFAFILSRPISLVLQALFVFDCKTFIRSCLYKNDAKSSTTTTSTLLSLKSWIAYFLHEFVGQGCYVKIGSTLCVVYWTGWTILWGMVVSFLCCQTVQYSRFCKMLGVSWDLTLVSVWLWLKCFQGAIVGGC